MLNVIGGVTGRWIAVADVVVVAVVGVAVAAAAVVGELPSQRQVMMMMLSCWIVYVC